MQLDFQTGVAPQTLVFGYIRWVDWSDFSVNPPVYEQATTGLLGEARPLIAYQDDWWTYNLGVGRQLTDALAGSVAITWEPSVGGEMTSLGPYDGRTTGTVALTYEVNGFDITGGLTYGVLGDTENLLEDRLQRRLGLGRRAPRRLHLLTGLRPNGSVLSRPARSCVNLRSRPPDRMAAFHTLSIRVPYRPSRC